MSGRSFATWASCSPVSELDCTSSCTSTVERPPARGSRHTAPVVPHDRSTSVGDMEGCVDLQAPYVPVTPFEVCAEVVVGLWGESCLCVSVIRFLCVSGRTLGSDLCRV